MVASLYEIETDEIGSSPSDEIRRRVSGREQASQNEGPNYRQKLNNYNIVGGYHSLKSFDTASVTSSRASSASNSLPLTDQGGPEDSLLSLEYDTWESPDRSKTESFGGALEDFLSESDTESVGLVSDGSSLSNMVKKIQDRQTGRGKVGDERRDDSDSDSESEWSVVSEEPREGEVVESQPAAESKDSVPSRRQSNDGLANNAGSYVNTKPQRASIPLPLDKDVSMAKDKDSDKSRLMGNRPFSDPKSSITEVQPNGRREVAVSEDADDDTYDGTYDGTYDDDDADDDTHEVADSDSDDDVYTDADEDVYTDADEDGDQHFVKKDRSGWLPELLNVNAAPVWGWAGAVGGKTKSTTPVDAVSTNPSDSPSPKAVDGNGTAVSKWDPPFRNFSEGAAVLFSRKSHLTDAKESQRLAGTEFNILRVIAPDSDKADVTAANEDRTAFPRTTTNDTALSKHLPVKTFMIVSEGEEVDEGKHNKFTIGSLRLRKPRPTNGANRRTKPANGRNKKNLRFSTAALKARVLQKLRKGIRKAARRFNIRISDKLLSKYVGKVKQLTRTLLKAVVPNGRGDSSKARGISFLNSAKRQTSGVHVDEAFASELLNDRGDDTSIVRASKYVAKGRELLQEAAKFKSEDPGKCRTITVEAHTYAYAARQMAKTSLMTRQAKKEELLRKPTDSDAPLTDVVPAHVDDDEKPIEPEKKEAWNYALTELQLFNFYDFLSNITCFGECSNTSVDNSAEEVEAALEILARISEEEKMTVNKALSKENKSVSSDRHNTSKSNLSHRSSGGVDGVDGRKSPKESSGRGSALNDLVHNIQSFYETDLVVSSSSGSTTEHGDNTTASVSCHETATSRDDDHTVGTERQVFDWKGVRNSRDVVDRPTVDEEDDEDEDDDDDSDDDEDEDTLMSLSRSQTRTMGSRSFLSDAYTSDHPFRYSSSSFSQSVAGTTLYSAGSRRVTERRSVSTRLGRRGVSRSGAESPSLRNESRHRTNREVADSEDIAKEVVETTGAGEAITSKNTSADKKKRFSWRLGGRKVSR